MCGRFPSEEKVDEQLLFLVLLVVGANVACMVWVLHQNFKQGRTADV
jgi:hypothetical protein